MMQRLVNGSIRRLLGVINLAPSRRPPFLRKLYPFRPDLRIQKLLGSELTAPTLWRATDALPVAEGGLAHLFFTTPNVHKWLHYLSVYEDVLRHLVGRQIRFLEIGVAGGGSLEMWRRYFGPAATIVGIDTEAACRQFDHPKRNIDVRIGKQQDVAFLRAIIDELGPFDVIVDDGSHLTSHMIESFRFLFLHGLADGGVYLAEDTHACYWTLFRTGPVSFVDFAKGLVDLMHAHYQDVTGWEVFRFGSDQRRSTFTVPLLTLLLERVEFYDSLVVLHRAKVPREVPVNVRMPPTAATSG